jgi:predicted permease
MDTLRHDLVHAFRSLRKSPSYAAVTILTLALGIGANSAIFSVVNGVLLKPLPYPDPDRLLFITSQFPALGFDQFWVSAPEFVEFRERQRSFDDVGAYRAGAVNLGTSDQPRRVNSAIVTSELMPVLGIQPMRGRQFTRADTLPGAEDVAVLSAEIWQSAFGRDESVVGRVIPVDGVPKRVVGIMPPGYDVHDSKVQVWLPLTLDPANPGNRGGHFLYLVGRLKQGIGMGQAGADVESMLAQWGVLNPKTHVPDQKNHRLRLDGLQDDLTGGIGRLLWVLQGAVGFVLLIACANLANLLLARAESRQKEFAIRSALGAGRWRLLRQFMTEGVVLAIAGGIIGAGLGLGGLRAMLAANPESLPRSTEIGLDPVVLIFTLAVSILTGMLFGMAPLLQLRERIVNISLKEAGQRSTAGAARARLRSGLVTIEVALAVVLVIGAGLLLRSLWNLTTVDAGFRRTQLVTFGLVLPGAQYREAQSRVDFFQRVTSKLTEISGVQSAAAMTGLPPQRLVNANDVDFESYVAPAEGPFENVDYFQTVTQPYLSTMGIPIVEGRDFTPADITGGPVVLVNETLARTFFRGRSVIGQRVRSFGPDRPYFTIVGVVRDVKQGGISTKTGTELYFLAEQGPRQTTFAPGNMNVVIRTSLPVETLSGQIRSLVQTMDPTLPIIKLRTMDEVFGESVSRPRFLAQLLSLFAALALALAAVGTYGILAYTVSQRRKEIGIHMALGATRSTVLRMVLGQGMRFTAAGLLGGVIAAFGLTRLLQAQLFNVKPTDPATIASVAVFIALVATAACLIPANRASRVDPMVVLRDE